jgi:hypothetical protein
MEVGTLVPVYHDLQNLEGLRVMAEDNVGAG